MTKKIDILGTEYTLRYENTRTQPVLEHADGECRWYAKEIIIDDELKDSKHKAFVIKHELLHAYLAESGLRKYREDEDVINWIAWHFDAIAETFRKVLQEQEECTK